MPHIPKAITEEGLAKDLQYILHGIDCHQVLANICPPRPGLKVLEAGCGSGKLGIWYAMRGADVWLLDVDDQALEYASKLGGLVEQATGQKVDFHLAVGSVLDLPHGDPKKARGWDMTNEFDFVFNEGVPHHWGYLAKDTRRQRCLNEMARVTKPGGWVCVIGTNGHCPQAVKMAETTDHTYLGMPPRQKPWTREELEERLHKAGLRFTESVPVGPSWEAAPLLAGWGQKPDAVS